MTDRSSYTFDAKKRQYRDGAGKLVSAAVILGLRDAIADDAASQTQAATVAYLQGGASLSDWALSMADAIQSSAVAAYLLGRGGSNALAPADHAAIDAMLAPHLAAARAFTLDLAASDATLGDNAPALDDNGDFATDENGDVVDENGDPILDSAGDPISAEEAAALWPGVLDLISRARSYETATFAGYSAGQSAAWDGAALPIMPPLHVNCFPAGTMVHGPKAIAGTERWWSGSLVEIETEGDRRLSVTPNHPILTTEGWIAAGLLNERHHLVCRPLGEFVLTSRNRNNDDVPSPIEEVVHALGQTSGVRTRTVPTAPEDFHGDGMHGYVNVVWADGELRDGVVNPAGFEHRQQDSFSGRLVVDSAFVCLRCLAALFKRRLAPARCIVSSFGQVGDLFRRGLGHAEIQALASSTGPHAISQQSATDRGACEPARLGQGFFRLTGQISRDDLRFGQTRSGNRRSGALGSVRGAIFGKASHHPAPTKFLSKPGVTQQRRALDDRNQCLPRDVTFDRIFQVRRRTFSGQVYNLETVNGWYFANGIITHNCRCTVTFDVADDGEVLGTWDAAAGACVICDDAEATYQQYGTGVYVSPDDAGMETEGE